MPQQIGESMLNVRSAAVVGAIVSGAMLGTVGVTAASAQPVAVASSQVGGPIGTSHGVGEVDRGARPLVHGSGHERAVDPDRISIKPIVDWIRSNAPSILPTLKTALKNGFNSFKNWWNGLAGWIRAAITAIGQMSLQELFSQLWSYFFG